MTYVCSFNFRHTLTIEISQGEYARTRALYDRLLDRTKHLNVWISYVKFEASAMSEDGGKSRHIRGSKEEIHSADEK